MCYRGGIVEGMEVAPPLAYMLCAANVLGRGQLLLSGSGFRRIRMRYIYIYRTQTLHQIYSRTFYNTNTHHYLKLA